jgi:hypothetical protein
MPRFLSQANTFANASQRGNARLKVLDLGFCLGNGIVDR